MGVNTSRMFFVAIAKAAGSVESIPKSWLMTKERVEIFIDRDKNECYHILLVMANQGGRQYAERSGKNDQWIFQADRCK